MERVWAEGAGMACAPVLSLVWDGLERPKEKSPAGEVAGARNASKEAAGRRTMPSPINLLSRGPRAASHTPFRLGRPARGSAWCGVCVVKTMQSQWGV